ncbi:putative spermidine/putrescine transport system permease protein [Pacificibacter maritimus]|uniref:Putative spermidine/putrescine transport system permease protein n=1 Tax=Pacificibacter maritimus TaxID=762213 RepID=A0A3N4UJN2_9RHOB|nr:ABC transporter permease [Pacificibacter maritimus]RPE67479.1 putative spermidine/putrescine transport system permease protein [Pacificibacter maritimus]
MSTEKTPNTPYLLTAPGVLFFAALLGAPMIMTLLLSLHSYDFNLGVQSDWTFGNYAEVIGDPYFQKIFGRTFGLALWVTVICVAIGVPEAYVLSRLNPRWRSIFLLIVLGPLLISVVVRTLGWALFFGGSGILSMVSQALGFGDEPVSLMFTFTGMTIALVHVLVPFMVISVWASLQKIDPQSEDAAYSLGASKMTVLRRITLPQAMPGILSGSIIVFALTASAFATPAIIGGRRLKVVATAAYDEYLSTLNWPLGAAIAVLLLIANIAIIVSYNKLVERRFAKVFE